MAEWALFCVGLLALVAATITIQRAHGVNLGLAPLVAVVRAAVQLSAIAMLLRGVLNVPWTVALFVVVMLTTASWTSAARIRQLWHGTAAAVAAVVSGGLASVLAVFALRLLDLDVRSLVAVAGILIGNAMTATTLVGRNFLRFSRSRRDEIEGWLALGATPAQAHASIAHESMREALIPNLDQTKATGLVTLPGAFVGALMGGASPVEAARFQLVVLAGIGLTMSVAGAVLTRIVAGSPTVPGQHES